MKLLNFDLIHWACVRVLLSVVYFAFTLVSITEGVKPNPQQANIPLIVLLFILLSGLQTNTDWDHFDRFGPRLPVTMVFFGGKTEMPIKLIFPSDSVFFPSLPYPSDILCQMLALLQYIFMCKIHNFHPCIHVGARSRSCLIASNLGWPGSSKSGSQDWFREQ